MFVGFFLFSFLFFKGEETIRKGIANEQEDGGATEKGYFK